MPQLTLQERIWLCEKYLRSYGTGRQGGPSLKKVRQSFWEVFHKAAPTNRNLLKIVKKFRETGSVHNANKGHSGRPCTSRINNNAGRVLEKILISPKKSQRRISKELIPPISRSSLRRILKDLGAFSYKIQILHELRPCDFSARVSYCARVLANLYENSGYLDNLWWSDESHFLLSGHVNRQNMRFLGWERPHDYEQRPLHSEKVTVWCALSRHGIIGPYFIEDGNGVALTVNSARYRETVIDRFHGDLFAFCELKGLDFDAQVFQQDGASCHTGMGNLEYLEYLFPEQLISRRSYFPYPAHSPDLTPLDAFLWGMLKQECFHDPIPRTTAMLKTNIEKVIASVNPLSCWAMVEKIAERMEVCLARNGEHVEHVIRR
jgi:hypothetical protein